eukprot:TRINITY_DN105652_c0_g1_i1.p1 TRINITY_DN105652_c0_g1~~TRINITY_DN105652_c0_g1_i1.p1  ORF type:complete len:664 (+),score=109.09 TRINITY_DN105652_c0_g1_i1:56-2047(+)
MTGQPEASHTPVWPGCSCRDGAAATGGCEACRGQQVIGDLLNQLAMTSSSLPPAADCQEAGKNLLALLKREKPSDAAVEAMQQMYQESLWSWQEGGLWAQCDSGPEDGSNNQSSSEQLEGDETLIGPDGDVYEIFYPSAGDPYEKEEVSTACSDSYVGSPVPMSRQTSAEAGIADVVDYMRTTALERYPARARLFELVQQSAADALGTHFERATLVGSTALRIDTPDSDLDVVVYTQPVFHTDAETGELSATNPVPPPCPVESLRLISRALSKNDPSLKLQLVDCARVPVLTAMSADGLSLDLTVDQPLGELHVHWFQSLWHTQCPYSQSVQSVPAPLSDNEVLGRWELGLEATTLRCIKWWLRRRCIPIPKEGGYPTMVWTLMVLHVLRCSLFVNNAGPQEQHGRALLGAIAAFFDRFSECRTGGTLCFSSGPEGTSTAFHPMNSFQDGWQASDENYGELSVLDPTTTSHGCAAWGIEPADLAPSLPPATRLLHAYELQRAQRLSAAALCSGPSASSKSGGVALRELFAEAGAACNTLPTMLPAEPTGVLLLRDGKLSVGILKKLTPKPGWSAPFLHRRDAQSAFAVELCNVRADGALNAQKGLVREHWFHPCDFVCMAGLKPLVHRGHCRGRYWRTEKGRFMLDKESLNRWHSMQVLLSQS